MSIEAPQPVDIELDRGRELRITWSDGVRSVYPLTLLRRLCLCAACRHAREEGSAGNPLRVIPRRAEQQGMVVADKAELVGNYALRITWQDGHDTGIYEYGFPRALSDRPESPAGQAAR